MAYRQSLLETDARIIAEDDNHIVLALRISKAKLRANHALLLAISNAVGSDNA